MSYHLRRSPTTGHLLRNPYPPWGHLARSGGWGVDCTYCPTDCTPARLSVVISGVTKCLDCITCWGAGSVKALQIPGAINGAYTLDQVDVGWPQWCTWQYTRDDNPALEYEGWLPELHCELDPDVERSLRYFTITAYQGDGTWYVRGDWHGPGSVTAFHTWPVAGSLCSGTVNSANMVDCTCRDHEGIDSFATGGTVTSTPAD